MTHFQYEAIKKYDNQEGKQPVWRCKLGWLLNRSKDFSTFTAELFLEMHITLFMLKILFFYLAVISVGDWNTPCGYWHFTHLVDRFRCPWICNIQATLEISGEIWQLRDSSGTSKFRKKMCLLFPQMRIL